MKPIDAVTGKSRGYFIVRKSPEHCETSVCKLTAEGQSWSRVSHFLFHHLPRVLKEHKPKTLQQAIYTVFKHFPKELYTMITLEHNQYMDNIAHSVSQSKLYSVVHRAVGGGSKELTPVVATLVLLSAPPRLFKELPPPLRAEWKELVDSSTFPPELEKEVLHLRYQIVNLTELCGKTDTCKQAQKCAHVCDEDPQDEKTATATPIPIAIGVATTATVGTESTVTATPIVSNL